MPQPAPMKIIFLDIDGVLNNHDILTKSGDSQVIDTQCVENLNAITQKTGALICISSSWRHDFEFSKLCEFLKKVGVKGQIIGATPSDTKRISAPVISRGEEIAAWLSEHPEVKSFVILDDFDDFLTNQKNRHVKTSMNGGLRAHHINLAVDILEHLLN